MRLVDSFGRRIEYLRVSVTDRCNYRCSYCMPRTGAPLGVHADLLRFEELTRLVGLFAELGVYKVRLTGGEPLVRRGVVDLAAMMGRLPGVTDLSLSTNGHLLERFAASLRQAGVQRVNVSLDSLDPAVFGQITGGGDLAGVLRGIDAAGAAGLTPIKLNMVVLRDINAQEIERMVAFAVERGASVRFIETMPVGNAGQASMTHYYPAADVLARVRRFVRTKLIPLKGDAGAGPARCYQIGAGPATVGVISAISRHFCDGCNRVRLTARGELVLCLGQQDRVSLRAPLRAGCSDGELKRIILEAIARKPERHRFLGDGHAARLTMSSLGG